MTLLEASASFQPLDKSLCASVAEDRPSAADRVQAAEAELRVIYQKHAQLEATVRALETQWHERQKKQQVLSATARGAGNRCERSRFCCRRQTRPRPPLPSPFTFPLPCHPLTQRIVSHSPLSGCNPLQRWRCYTG